MKKIITLLKKISPIGIGKFKSMHVGYEIETTEGGSWFTSGDCLMYETTTLSWTIFGMPIKKIKKIVYVNVYDFFPDGERLTYIYEY
jgi:hypothetical protein